ncbi:f-box domain-containing protein [Gigaspora margarita]|uniref:F-box domain-containing protein n=1 Tax=Gigaspora margarita TaxID=4874 RepID=A0A8H4ERJ5_GIGMA|nr:f-box domain-containing protein [Gigaspora margarita]
MTALPLECYYAIFNNLLHNYKSLFSCALVSRHWCRIIIPILWSEPGNHYKDKRLIRILLLALNAEEQTLLIPFNISLPSHQKTLFEYTSYITSITSDLIIGVRNLFPKYESNLSLETTVKFSLIAMLVRTSINLKHLIIDEIICNPLIFENLYEKTTLTSVDLYLKYNISGDLEYKAIDGLVKILYKNSTLNSLNLRSATLGTKGVITLLEALCNDTVLKSLEEK